MAETTPALVPPSEGENVRSYVQLQQDEIKRVLQPIQDRLGDAVVGQTTGIGTIQKSLRKALNGRMKAQRDALQDIGNELQQALLTRIDEQQVAFNHSVMQLPSGVPATPSYFPTQQLSGQSPPHGYPGLWNMYRHAGTSDCF